MGPSIMGSEDEVDQSLGQPCPAAGPSGLTRRIVPQLALWGLQRPYRLLISCAYRPVIYRANDRMMRALPEALLRSCAPALPGCASVT
jgi:hypothetical protein